jgi:hypothetical protein
MCSRNRKLIFELLLLLSCMFMSGCDNAQRTDCYEMRTSQGLRADGTPCMCTFYYPSQNGSPKPPACYTTCRDNSSGNVVNDCSAPPPL